ncbi:Crp/Fnr family transcriptional regulator [Winogradskyella ursingii]|uniref:Crp/Fnr family transcriptional regulator n=1 Tax=Winogradskyella ursingii TaxID=2686079 RepID=UPI0015CDD582|nr:Crp/Fnr family transcriptional regulator [Winogradskyella ursingii]
MSQQDSHINTIFKNVPLSDEELERIDIVLHHEEYKKGEKVFESGDIVNNMYYIWSGCLRTYCIEENGKEHTLQFGIKDWWITDFSAFFSRSEAMMNLEVIENAKIYKLSIQDWQNLCNDIVSINTYGRNKLESAFSMFQRRILSNMSLSAQVRYKNFVKQYPDIEAKVKNYHIASYLGITNESLSRIRKEIYKK